MSEKNPNAKIDKALLELFKACEGDIPPEKESSIKVKVEVLKAAMTWEKLKHGIRDKESEGTEWGTPGE